MKFINNVSILNVCILLLVVSNQCYFNVQAQSSASSGSSGSSGSPGSSGSSSLPPVPLPMNNSSTPIIISANLATNNSSNSTDYENEDSLLPNNVSIAFLTPYPALSKALALEVVPPPNLNNPVDIKSYQIKQLKARLSDVYDTIQRLFDLRANKVQNVDDAFENMVGAYNTYVNMFVNYKINTRGATLDDVSPNADLLGKLLSAAKNVIGTQTMHFQVSSDWMRFLQMNSEEIVHFEQLKMRLERLIAILEVQVAELKLTSPSNK